LTTITTNLDTWFAEGIGRRGRQAREAWQAMFETYRAATGSEVHLALEARDELEADGTATRVVSMPCWELFDRQPPDYRDQVLPPGVTARVAVEQASTLGWDRYVGPGGAVVGMHTSGASAPLKQLLTKFGFTPEQVAHVARERVAAARDRRA
jgi:transketolase